MPKNKKINNFRTLNLSTETTPTDKKVRSVSKVKNKTSIKNKKQNSNFVDEKIKNNNNLGLIIFFLILIVLGAGVGCLFTPAFNVSNIVVEDGQYVSADEILNKTKDIIETNIFRINKSKYVDLIKENPYIKDAQIKRVLPNEIRVEFEERTPYALIKYLESYVVVDKYGYVLEIKKENDMPDLAIIYGINSDEYVQGKKIMDVSGLKYENITYLLETSYSGDFDYTIYEINYADTEKLIMAVKELDIDINFGEIDRSILSEKMIYLNGILKKLGEKKGNLDISSNNYLEKTIFTERY